MRLVKPDAGSNLAVRVFVKYENTALDMVQRQIEVRTSR